MGGLVKEWVTVKEAAVLVGRAPRTIYEWIQQEKLATQVNTAGATVVLAKAVGRIVLERKRGRPRGVPTRRM